MSSVFFKVGEASTAIIISAPRFFAISVPKLFNTPPSINKRPLSFTGLKTDGIEDEHRKALERDPLLNIISSPDNKSFALHLKGIT